MVTLVRDEQNVPSFDLALSPMQGERCSPEDWVLCFLSVPLTALKCLKGVGSRRVPKWDGKRLPGCGSKVCSGLRSSGYCSNLAGLAEPAGRERGGNARAALSGKEIGRAFSCLCHRCSVSSIGNQKKGNSEVSIASGTPSVTATSKIYAS